MTAGPWFVTKGATGDDGRWSWVATNPITQRSFSRDKRWQAEIDAENWNRRHDMPHGFRQGSEPFSCCVECKDPQDARQHAAGAEAES